jgi:hypothetical protein
MTAHEELHFSAPKYDLIKFTWLMLCMQIKKIAKACLTEMINDRYLVQVIVVAPA